MNLEEIKTQYSKQILAIAKRRKIDDVRVFGSVARGEETEKSDIDFLVHLLPEGSLIDLSGFNIDLSELLNRKVDIIPDNSIHPLIKDKILSEAVKI